MDLPITASAGLFGGVNSPQLCFLLSRVVCFKTVDFLNQADHMGITKLQLHLALDTWLAHPPCHTSQGPPEFEASRSATRADYTPT